MKSNLLDINPYWFASFAMKPRVKEYFLTAAMFSSYISQQRKWNAVLKLHKFYFEELLPYII